jgi:uncharacterized membrane protein YjgN (DUF898 family)
MENSLCDKCGASIRNTSGVCALCGHKVVAMATMSKTATHQPTSGSGVNRSFFDGRLLDYVWQWFVGSLLTIFTLGLAYPWALCYLYSWEINHTVINGQRLKFLGKPLSLFGLWIKWFFLCIITLGIYSFWLFISLKKWKTANTVVVG